MKSPLVLYEKDENLFEWSDYIGLVSGQAASIAFKGALGSNPLGALGPFIIVMVIAILGRSYWGEVANQFGLSAAFIDDQFNSALLFIVIIIFLYIVAFLFALVIVAPYQVWRNFPKFARGELANLRKRRIKREQKKLLSVETEKERELKFELLGIARRNLYPACDELGMVIHLAVRAAVKNQLGGRLPEFYAGDVRSKIFEEIEEIKQNVGEAYVQSHSFRKVYEEYYSLGARYKTAVGYAVEIFRLNNDIELYRWENDLPSKLQAWYLSHGRYEAGIQLLAQDSKSLLIEQLNTVIQSDTEYLQTIFGDNKLAN